MGTGPAELRIEVRPRWPFRLPRRGGLDGVLRVRGGVLHRLVAVDEERVLVRVAQTARDVVLFGAQARSPAAAAEAIVRMRRALGVDQDLREFHRRFSRDPLIGPGVRADPALRVTGTPDPFEALAWAICEQLIEYQRAAAIQRRIVRRLGHRCAITGLSAPPGPRRLAAEAPARLVSFDLTEGRALALLRAAREVAAGRVDLDGPEPELGWRRLHQIRGIGRWTVQMLALRGQGRLDQLPAADLAYLKLVGRLRSGGDPWSRASEADVVELFAPYHPWGGLAGAYALRSRGLAAGALG